MGATREEIRQRDGNCCARCGHGGALHVHHRVRRSQGGKDDSPNLITLCEPCHRWTHANPMAARREGLLLSRSTDPGAVPVDHHQFPDGPVLLGPELTFRFWAA
jgi:5-methylcytosine-specific restriction endonuclease McrA